MKIQTTLFLALVTLMMGSAHAVITVSDTDLVITDHPQTGGDTDFYNSLTVATGNTPIQTGSNRFSLDGGDVFGQSFTLASAITLDSIYMAYNDQQSSGNFDLLIDVGNTGTANFTYTVTLSTASDLQTGGGNNGPFHFIQFDLSAANIALGAGTHSFSLANVTDGGPGGFVIAPNFANDNYAGGNILSSTGGPVTNDTAHDSFFAVTAVPEASTALLVLFAGSALLLRRRTA